MISPRSVSYTHLDVYKRQVLNVMVYLLIVHVAVIVTSSAGIVVGISLSQPVNVSVSYTHLDVYKRQVVNIVSINNI